MKTYTRLPLSAFCLLLASCVAYNPNNGTNPSPQSAYNVPSGNRYYDPAAESTSETPPPQSPPSNESSGPGLLDFMLLDMQKDLARNEALAAMGDEKAKEWVRIFKPQVEYHTRVRDENIKAYRQSHPQN